MQQCKQYNTIATSCIENVSAKSETSVDTSRYKELSLSPFSDSSKQVAVHFIRQLDEYFTLRKTPEELRLPLVFRSVSDPFAKQWLLATYGQLKSYDDFQKPFTDSQKVGVVCMKTDVTTGRGKVSPNYIRYANLANMLSPAMSDQDLLSALITHYEPRIQNCLISTNLKSTQEALAFLTKLQSPENSREQYRPARRDFEHQDQNRGTPRDQPIDSTGNHRPNDSVQVRRVRRDGRDRNPRCDSMRNLRTTQGRMGFFFFRRSGET
jgi:hypothetical protein